jgi:hypothetical protein
MLTGGYVKRAGDVNRRRYGLRTMIELQVGALHTLQIAHHQRALGGGVAYHQAFTNEAAPKEGDGKRDGR